MPIPVLRRCGVEFSNIDNLFVRGQERLHHPVIIVAIDRLLANVNSQINRLLQTRKKGPVFFLVLDAAGKDQLCSGLLRHCYGEILSLALGDPSNAEKIIPPIRFFFE